MMDSKGMIKQMVAFNKAVFEKSFKKIELLQEQADQMAKTMSAQAAWFPDEGKKVLDGLVGAYKSNLDSFKAAMDGYFENVEKSLAD